MLKELTIAAFLALAIVASVDETSAFSNTGHRITSYSTLSNPSALAESFDDEYEPPEKKGFFANFFEELDAFVDDATSRRLGAGAQYYGKRKSSFYGKDDVNKKRNRNVADNTEDYRGPSNAGYFKWMPDAETGEMKPVTRLREVNIEKKTRL
eukprot:CAMPEP_0181141384 /NCGR_PEP_ID=MMETSP1071-20121207/35794_1 /TAXON_ID=35127 /ORGANISM="Thalassiosira sp., Strain NH16" /LENGTH=152 /DNA_ID=CAMNT_0023228369 /DNA_START=82 /DNA_END=540 /DNA_ORIENTATION=+